jgi:hypothetical protein
VKLKAAVVKKTTHAQKLNPPQACTVPHCKNKTLYKSAAKYDNHLMIMNHHAKLVEDKEVILLDPKRPPKTKRAPKKLKCPMEKCKKLFRHGRWR